MEFVEMPDAAAPEVSKIGAVQYVAYRRMSASGPLPSGTAFYSLFPNGARVAKHGVMVAIAPSPMEAWQLCAEREDLMRDFGVETTHGSIHSH